MAKIERFEDMPVWQESQNLAVEVYKATKNFPPEELYSLTNQLRRSASSVSANIAEGFGRRSTKERMNFYHIALGSLLETKNFLYLAVKLRYITHNELVVLIKSVESIHKQINAIIRHFRISL